MKLQGDIYAARNLFSQATDSYRRCLQYDQRNLLALNNIGHLLYKLGKVKDAKKFLNRAIANDVSYAPSLYNLAMIHVDEKQYEQAEELFENCIKLAPKMSEAFLMLDFVRLRIYEEHTEETQTQSIDLLETAVNSNPEDVRPKLQLIKAYENVKEFEKADILYREIHAASPKVAFDLEKTSRLMMNRLEQEKSQRYANMAAKMSDEYSQFQLFMSVYLAVLPMEESYQSHVNWSEAQCADLRDSQFQHPRITGKPDKLRIGYVSPDFYFHAISFFIRGILEHHDRDKVEVFCYAQLHTSDDASKQLEELTDHWREIQHLDDYQAARLINQDKIDILVDLAGHCAGTRLSLFAYKPAPIQATYMGYPGSTGLREMDYWISDWSLHPEDTPEPSSEEKYRLNRSWIAYTIEDYPDIEAKRKGTPITFGVVNHIGKHSSEFIDAWAAILTRIPEAEFIIKSTQFSDADLRIQVLDLLERKGVDRERVYLIGQSRTHLDHLNTYNSIDVCLDPFPYTGGTSTADALVMGSTVITLGGNALRERLCTSILKSINKESWVTNSVEDYVDLACEMALKGVTLEDKFLVREAFFKADITDSVDLTINLERAYENMWDRYSRSSA